jgi:hypothetical protein
VADNNNLTETTPGNRKWGKKKKLESVVRNYRSILLLGWLLSQVIIEGLEIP